MYENNPTIAWLRDSLLPSLDSSISAAARETGISHKTLKGLLDGSYQGNGERQLAKLEEQRQRLTLAPPSQRANVDLKHIPTQLMAHVHAAADAAKAAGLINMIVGKSQMGKTTAARAYKMRYPETTIYLRMPTRPTTASIVRHLLAAMSQASRPMCSDAGMTILRSNLSARHLIIVDEAHAALGRPIGLDALDIIRELHDITGCAVLLIVTDIGARLIDKGAAAERLLQLVRRGERQTLDPTPSKPDIIAILRAYGLPTPNEEQRNQLSAMARATCFGQICHRLALAYVEAKRLDETLSWAHFESVQQRACIN